jgi:hypothetical protein
MALIHAVMLDEWAKTTNARDSFGELLRRLIRSNIELAHIQNIRFLAHESNQLSGWDGILECQSNVPWVPSGTSVWELGTSENARQKIRDDFSSRREKELPSGWDRARTTYVAVALHKLDSISDLESELKTNSPWMDVKILDTQSLEEWIEISTDVEVWSQEQGLGPPATVQTLSRYWRGWSGKTQPPVSTRLILAGRAKDAGELLNHLVSRGVPINIQADSPEEAIVFVYSVIDASNDILFRQHFLSRSLVIKQEADTFRFLRDSSPKNIILFPQAASQALALVGAGHRVINALGNKPPALTINLRLTRSLRSSFEEALISMGIKKEEAGIEAQACGSSPSIWRIWNLIRIGYPGDEIPDGAKSEYADLIVPAVLLGGWSEKFEGDKEIIKKLTGKEYKTYRDKLIPFVTRDNPLLVKVGDDWVISAPATAFALTLNFITQGHLEILSDIFNDVFSEIDPTINLPTDERRYAGIRDIHLKHSSWLRDGLAETLLRFAIIGRRLEDNGVIPGNQSCQSYVNTLVRNLKGLNSDWRLLASLRNQLPVLAEASPLPFVEALERLLQGSPEELLPLFEEGEDVLFGHSYHSGLLWTLETLAWSPTYLGRVIIILAQLAKIDPGGRTANRPINSLREILLAWHPGTSATFDQRIKALDLLLERVPDIGWKVLMKLMPKSYGESSFSTNEPIWRDFGRSDREILTNKIVRDTYVSIIDRAISHVGRNPDRWVELIDYYDDVSNDHRRGIEEGLKEIAKTDLTEEDRKKIWDTLREFISKHREFPDADWSLQDDRIKNLELIMKSFPPIDDIARFSWLFNEFWPDIPFPKDDHDKYDEEIKRLRRNAIEYLWQKDGITSIRKLVTKVSFPGSVSAYVFELLKNEMNAMQVIEETNQGSIGEQVFARNLSLLSYNKYGARWTDMLLEKAKELSWPPQAIANALLVYPDSRITFELISSLGKEIEREYWKSRENWIRMKDDKEALSFAIEKFIGVERAIDILTFASHYAKSLKPELLFRLLDGALNELNQGKTPMGNLGYYIEEIFDGLRSHESIDETMLARKEYLYLPLLTSSHKVKDLTLHKIMAKDAKFFVDVLCDLYRQKSAPKEKIEPSENAKNRGEFAWHLLRTWKHPPGIDDNGQIIEGTLKRWVTEARKLADGQDRIEINDLQIGHVLFHYPDDPTDGIWPHKELRRLIEDIQNDQIEHGIEIEQFNSRGVVSKGLYEGGKQERLIAQKWRSWAEKIDIRWLRTRVMLERIAAQWDAHAKMEDERAEKDRLRFR